MRVPHTPFFTRTLLGCLAAFFPALASPAPIPGTSLSLADCDALVQSHPEHFDAYDCYRVVAARTAEWDEAIRRLEVRLAIEPDNPWATHVLAWIDDLGGRDRAETRYRTAAERYAARDNATGAVGARIGLSHHLQRRGRLEEAREALRLAGEIAAETSDPLVHARLDLARGRQAQREHDYGRAFSHFRRVEEIVFPDGPAQLRLGAISGLGFVAWATGRHADALAAYRRCATLARSIGDRYAEADARYNVALLARERLGAPEIDLDLLAQLVREARDAAVAVGNRGAEAAVLAMLGELPNLDLRERVAHLERALAINRERGNTVQTAAALRLLAGLRLAETPDRPETAFGLVEEALALARTTGNLADRAHGLMVRGALHRRQESRDEAVADWLAALDAVEKIRDLQPDAEVRARTFSAWTSSYYRLIGLLLGPPGTPPADDDLDRAFAVAERLRSRVLLETLDGAGATVAIAVDDPAAAQRDDILDEISRVQTTLMEPGLPEGARQDALDTLEGLEIEEAVLRDRLARRNGTFATLRRPAIPSVAEVREHLTDDQAMLAYVLSTRETDPDRGRMTDHGGSWVFVLTRETARVYPLPDRVLLEKATGVFLGLLERRDGLERRPAARLYEDLLHEPLADLPAEIHRLVLVPDGVLHRLPLELLAADPGAPPLAARFEITRAPSATLWGRWKRSPASHDPLPALALADPHLAYGTTAAATERGSPWLERLALGTLPYARREARAVVRHLGRGSRLLEGEEASEHWLKTHALGKYALLHLATHTVVDGRRPERSAVLLTAGAPDEDGLLQIREIVGLDLDGRAVVLSTCQGAGGEIVDGEGVIGLARGFFLAGARTVVASLWPLRDDETAILIERFARALASGDSVAAALTAARRERIAAGAPAAAWAGLIVLGDGDLVPFPAEQPGRLARYAWVPVVMVLLIGASLLLWRRWHRRERP